MDAPQPVQRAFAPRRRGGVWTGDRLIIWGGLGNGGALNSGGRLGFNASGDPLGWQPVSLSGAPSARSGHTAVWTGQRLIVWGGRNGGTRLGDGALYDPATDTWQPTSALGGPTPRSGHNGLWAGGEMIVFGGETAAGATADGYAYDPVKDMWRTLSGAGNPLIRTEATAVWTGHELAVFGGRAGGQAVGALQRLVPQPNWYFYRKP